MGDAQARLAVDPLSLEFIKGSRLNFVDDLMGSAFKFENPNATAACGCGAVRGVIFPFPVLRGEG